jgi:fructose-specific phosphotransferase system IIA component
MLKEILSKATISVGLKAKNKEDLILQMMELILKSGVVRDPGKALEEIKRRERIMSTGIGKGIALPHAKTDAVNKMAIAIAVLDEPVAFEALDDEPVDIVFMLLGTPTNISDHLKTLSEVSHFLNNEEFKSSLRKAKDAGEVLNLFQ